MWLKWKIVVNFIMKLIYVWMKNFSEGLNKGKYEVINEIDRNLALKTNYS